MGTISNDVVIAELYAPYGKDQEVLDAYKEFVASVPKDGPPFNGEVIRSCFTPAIQVVNGLIFCAMLPDGSKEWWDTSDRGNEVRELFIAWIKGQNGTVVHVRWGELGESLEVI